jgi:hypothetical protein
LRRHFMWIGGRNFERFVQIFLKCPNHAEPLSGGDGINREAVWQVNLDTEASSVKVRIDGSPSESRPLPLTKH